MQVFVAEWTCFSGPASGAMASLRNEGWAMLAALVEDLASTPGVEPITLLHAECPPTPVGFVVRVAWRGDWQLPFDALASAADWTVVIAPECEGLLARLSRRVLDVGGRLLGSTPEAIELTGDKLVLCEHFERRAIPTPACRLPHGGERIPAPFFPAVCKPRDGAGSQATVLVRGPDELARWLKQARNEGWQGELLLQAFVPGQAVSVAFLMGHGLTVPLVPAEQRLSCDGRFHYLGGSLPLRPPLAERAVDLARRAVSAVSGLQGYVGVDLVLGSREDGGGDVVIEINPRLTTSYVGLRALARSNLARAWVQLIRDATPPVLDWKRGTVHFDCDGKVSFVQELDSPKVHRL